MNKKLLATLILLVVIIQTSASAEAALFDWISKKDTKDNSVEGSWSFDNLYRNIKPSDSKDLGNQISSQNSVLALANPLPTNKLKIKAESKTFLVDATGYSSTPDQTDSTPFITASGTFVRDGVVAANFLPIGTRIKIPELFGDKQFIVEDRMNSRYWYRVDVWFPDRESALQFGLKKIKVEIVS
jgi:3D (Asp-Asp-Asp) domain-containing protein